MSGIVVVVFVAFSFADSHSNLFAQDEEQVRKAAETFFENRVRPVLSRHCYTCHGPRKQKSSLRLDSREAMLEGGDSGGVLEPGNPEDSLLLEVLLREEDQMPPGKRLKPNEIAAIRQWIDAGAVWPQKSVARTAGGFTAEDRNYWAFRPITRKVPMRDSRDQWSRNEIDHAVWKNFSSHGVIPEPAADRIPLMRRVYFDLIGLPPNPTEQDEFLRDKSPDAYERLVERLLNDPRHAEKWARHWLDLVRYAESDGYKADDYRPDAWRYRDYVIQALHQDKPFDQFVLQQLAGDELDRNDPENLVATGYLRHWIYEYNQRDVRTQWDTILNDVTNVTADVFLGLSLGCARCHDHKFDPIPQEDYFRLKAFFAPMQPRDDLPLATDREIAEYRTALKKWEAATAEIRSQIDRIEYPYHQKKMNPEINKFPLDIRPMMRKPVDQRTTYEQQLATLAFKQVKKLAKSEMQKKLSGEEKKKWEKLQQELAKFDALKPRPLPKVLAATDAGPVPPPTRIPDEETHNDIQPGVLSVLDPTPMKISPPPQGNTTGRRLAFARWLVSRQNPLTARVMVNRIWQYHFGEGIVASSSDFGRLGKRPADPMLLDYLASEFIRGGWSIRRIHRKILLSATYRQRATDRSLPGLRPFQQRHRRLDAEQIRDAMLAVSGDLIEKRGGPSAESKENRRTIYTRVIRNHRDPLLDVFDAPDNFNSTAVRNTTTTPTQSLLMINGEWTLARARSLANRLAGEKNTLELIRKLYRIVYCRPPTRAEIDSALSFLGVTGAGQKVELAALVDLCHVLLNSNEFLYLD